ncbi:hypothetical protein GRJ2_002544900 [Grus japonensis]|uniref:Secreted protein n=1 Tax=Grus japonensis TaxID=30415 RepID=A0ABC9XTD9_GRUJA
MLLLSLDGLVLLRVGIPGDSFSETPPAGVGLRAPSSRNGLRPPGLVRWRPRGTRKCGEAAAAGREPEPPPGRRTWCKVKSTDKDPFATP